MTAPLMRDRWITHIVYSPYSKRFPSRSCSFLRQSALAEYEEQTGHCDQLRASPFIHNDDYCRDRIMRKKRI